MSDRDSFDPYRKWLGIPPSEQPPTHYRLLAIAEFESDPDVISYAADRCMAHVRTFQSGSRAALSQQMLNELAEARLCLLDPDKKAAYDAQLRAARPAAPPPPAAPIQPPAPIPRPAAPVPVAAPGVVPVSAMPQAVAAQPSTPSFSSSPSSSVRRRRKKSSPVPMIVALVASAALVVVLIVALSNKAGQQTVPAASVEAEEGPLPKPTEGSRQVIRRTDPVDRKTEQDEALREASEPEIVDEPGGEFEFSAVDKALSTAREAIKQRDYELARRTLKEAGETATGRQADRVGNMGKIADYMESFDQALLAGAEALEPGAELAGGRLRTVKLVRFEREPAPTIVISSESGEASMSLFDVTTALAMRIAGPQLRNDPGGKLYQGTFLALHDSGQRVQVHNLWYQAIRDGLASRSLVEELDLPYRIEMRPEGTVAQLAGTRLPVPEGEELREAVRKMRETFKDDFASARSAREKAALARKLYRIGREERSPTAKYALLTRACEYEVELVNCEQILKISSELSSQFDLDLLDLMGTHLTKASSSASTAEQQNQVFEYADKLFYEARVAGRYDAAERAVRIAISIARKAKQFQLVRVVEQELKKLDAIRPLLERATEAREVLIAKPDDPQALTWLGEHECFVKENWEEGLQMLAKGDDPELAELAKSDLAYPADAEARIALAKRWQARAARGDAVTSAAMLGRARHWLDNAQRQLSGLQAAAVRRQIEEIDKELSVE